MKVKVLSVFRDKFTGVYYNSGDVIEIGDESRVTDIEERGLGERIEVEKAPVEKKESKIPLFEREIDKKALVDLLKAIDVQASGNMKEETLLAIVTGLNEESTAKLKKAMNVEI